MRMGITIEMSQLISRISLGSILKITELENNKKLIIFHIKKKALCLIRKIYVCLDITPPIFHSISTNIPNPFHSKPK